MKLLVAVCGLAAMIGLAGPAHSDPGVPGVENGGFLAELQAAGITYSDPAQVVSAAQAVCGLADRGETGLQIISDVKTNNPGLTTDNAAKFVAISARSFCPHHLLAKTA